MSIQKQIIKRKTLMLSTVVVESYLLYQAILKPKR